ncbi:hypothetical protein [Streptomyces sp. cmx-4-9]|uniref:hypothetical protein n=1 Tax=Streptomyces sp. cmx-4-9 TaxID=2790941 RepID=UPI00397FD03E
MNTLWNALTVLAVAALLAGPALHGLLAEHRTDRQLRAARQQSRRPAQERPRPGIRSPGSRSPWAGALAPRRTERT